MSLLEGLTSTLAGMGLVQLALVFVAVAAYALAINGSFGSTARSGAASAAFVAAVAFTALTPSWMSGIVFLALAVLAVAVFAGSAWAVATLLGLGDQRGTVVGEVDDETPAPMHWPVPQAVRSLAASLIRAPL